MITVDFQALIPQSLLALIGGNAFLQQVLDDIASSARAKWIRLAQQSLRSSKRDYIEGIQDIEGAGAERSIALVGWLANAVESGMPSRDLRTTLLQNTRSGTRGGVRISKDGSRYRSIPFRHGTPGSSGQAGQPMGRRYGPQGAASFAHAAEGSMDKGQAAQLGKRIYSLAKQLRPGQRLAAGHAPRLAPWHQTDVFAGMQRTRKTYGRSTQSHYSTFRTISEANPTGWIHPGIQGRHLIPQVEEHVRKIIPATIGAAIKAALGDL